MARGRILVRVARGVLSFELRPFGFLGFFALRIQAHPMGNPVFRLKGMVYVESYQFTTENGFALAKTGYLLDPLWAIEDGHFVGYSGVSGSDPQSDRMM